MAEPRAQALDYLRLHRVATLASIGAEGPWAAAVFYVNDGFTLYFLSSPGSRHCANLTQDARVAATVQEDYADWRQIKGIQLQGTVELLAGEEEASARKLYGGKYPLVGRIGGAPAAIVQALAKVRWYRLVPARLYFIDNAAGFGHRDEIALAETR
ncbi:MAG TPA: pyridoxamine 5'-phosphate oxidase family protein [Rhodocyclaceae bacterium]|nr:pyridoxamine 5'-phosphate oxidase family protein [Rhodocyclaceae bacterium]